jgi:hypothetical protein
MGGKRSRDKGANYERDIARRWRESGLFPEAKRGIGQTRAGGDVPDVDGTPFWVECKDRKSHSSLKAYFKQCAAATDGRTPLVVMHYPQTSLEDSYVALRLKDFEEMLSRLQINMPYLVVRSGGV